jgi:chromosome segregation ATPase
MTDKLYNSAHDKITKLEDSLRQATIHYEEAELQVDRFFAEMRRILTAEEDGLKAKIKEMVLGFESKCREREGKLNDQLDNLQQLVDVVTQGGNAENVEFLQTIKDRD